MFRFSSELQKNVIFGLKRKKIREIVGSVDAIKMQNVISSPHSLRLQYIPLHEFYKKLSYVIRI